MVENLRLLFQDVNTVNIERFWSLQHWINEANDEGYWNQLVKHLLHLNTPLPERPETWGPLPLWRALCAAGERCPSNRDANVNDDDDKGNSNNGNDDSRNHRGGHCNES